VNRDTATTIRLIKTSFLLSRGNHKAERSHIQSAIFRYSTVTINHYKKVAPTLTDTEMSNANSVTDILSQEEKIKQLPRKAIEDIFARQMLLKADKQYNGYTTRDDDVFRGLDMENDDVSLFEAVQFIDIQFFMDLRGMDGDLVDAALERLTKEVEGDKVEAMRHQLITTSECCGVPRARLCHNNVDAWAEIEGV